MNKKNKRGLFLDKKAEEIAFPVVLRIIIYLVFFSILFLFVHLRSTGASIYEQAYAKQIVLMIDSAGSPTKIVLDFKEGIEVAEKNKITSKANLVSVKNNEVIVKLSDSGGYGFKYFSEYELNSYFDENNLIITINEKNE